MADDPTRYGTADPDGTYRPDPAAENAALIEAFFAALADAVPDRPDLPARLRARHERLLAEHRHHVVDEPSRHNLALTLAILAAYRELAPAIGDAELLPLLRDAFVEPIRPMVEDVTRRSLDASPDPFATMVEITRLRERDFFGAAFTFNHPEDDDRRFTSRVERCFYHDVLAANDATRLMPILCAFDANWMDAVDPARHGFTVERPATIGTGGPNCPFRFRRTR